MPSPPPPFPSTFTTHPGLENPARARGIRIPNADPNDYTIERDLAHGGMGRVLIAQDRRLQRTIALKQLIERDPEREARFFREMRITAQLQHPGIVNVYECGRWPDGEPFFAMQWIDGEPLDQLMVRKSTLAERLRLLPHLISAADAIAYAGSKGVVHRDLKPSNVLVGKFGETVVIDWGLARELGTPDDSPGPLVPSRDAAQTVLGAVMGTPAYMSPEQAQGQAVDTRTDVYSLGAMLYQLLSGNPPYQGSSAPEIISRVCTVSPPRLNAADLKVPRELISIVERAMARQAEDRYGSAKDFSEDLKHFQNGQLLSVHTYSLTELLGRWVRKHRAPLGVAAVFLAMLTLLLGFSVRQIRQERDSATLERDNARSHQNAAETLAQFMLKDLRAALLPLGRVALLERMAKAVIKYHQSLPPAAAADSKALSHHAEALGVLAEAAGVEGSVALGRQAIEESLSLHRRLALLQPKGSWKVSTGVDLLRLADFQLAAGDIAEGRASLSEAQSLIVQAPASRETALLLERRADLAKNDGNLKEAVELFGQELALYNESSSPISDFDDQRVVWRSHLKLAEVFQLLKQPVDGHMHALKAIDMITRSPREWRTGPLARADLGHAYAREAKISAGAKDFKQALAPALEGLRIRRALSEEDPDNAESLRAWDVSLSQVGELQRDLGDLPTARDTFAAALDVSKRLAHKDPQNLEWQRDLSVAHLDLGDTERKLKHLAAAREQFLADLEISRALSKRMGGGPERRSRGSARSQSGGAGRVPTVAVDSGRDPQTLPGQPRATRRHLRVERKGASNASRSAPLKRLEVAPRPHCHRCSVAAPTQWQRERTSSSGLGTLASRMPSRATP